MQDLSHINAILVYFDTNMYSRLFDDQTRVGSVTKPTFSRSTSITNKGELFTI
jgi:hypothetical protein